jgi:hypothetical protein
MLRLAEWLPPLDLLLQPPWLLRARTGEAAMTTAAATATVLKKFMGASWGP